MPPGALQDLSSNLLSSFALSGVHLQLDTDTFTSLKRRDELRAPNCPFESITTGMGSLFPVVTPRIHAAKNEFWLMGFARCAPMRMPPLTFSGSIMLDKTKTRGT